MVGPELCDTPYCSNPAEVRLQLLLPGRRAHRDRVTCRTCLANVVKTVGEIGEVITEPLLQRVVRVAEKAGTVVHLRDVTRWRAAS